MKILLINVHSFHNAGDFVLTLESLQQLYRIFPGSEVTIAMNDPDSYKRKRDTTQEKVVPSFFAWFRQAKVQSGIVRYVILLQLFVFLLVGLFVAALYRIAEVDRRTWVPTRYRSSVSAYLDADIVVSVGGNFIYSRGHKMGLPLLMPLFTILYGSLCKKPLYMLPQTIGPIWRGWERALLGQTLRRFRLLLLRDPKSLELIQTLNIGDTRATVVPDLAFLSRPASMNSAEVYLHRCGVPDDRPLLGVTLINWSEQYPPFTRQRQYEQAVADAVRHFVTIRGGHAVLFAQVCGPTSADDDRIPAQRVHDLLSNREYSDRIHLIGEELPPEQLQAAYGQMDLFLGSRLHSNIFALTQYIPVLAIAYQDKTVGVMRMMGLEEWTLRIENVDSVVLVKLLDKLWQQRLPVRQQIMVSMTQMQSRTNSAINQIARDYARLSSGQR